MDCNLSKVLSSNGPHRTRLLKHLGWQGPLYKGIRSADHILCVLVQWVWGTFQEWSPQTYILFMIWSTFWKYEFAAEMNLRALQCRWCGPSFTDHTLQPVFLGITTIKHIIPGFHLQSQTLKPFTLTPQKPCYLEELWVSCLSRSQLMQTFA